MAFAILALLFSMVWYRPPDFQVRLIVMPRMLCDFESDADIITSVVVTDKEDTSFLSYRWQDGRTTKHYKFAREGHYSVTVTDHRRHRSAHATVYVPSILQATLQIKNVSCLNGADGVAGVFDVVGGSEPYSFQWSTGDMGREARHLKAGNISLTIRDAWGCSTVVRAKVFEPPDALEIRLNSVKNMSSTFMDGAIDFDTVGGTPPYRVLAKSNWTSLFAGNHRIRVQDAMGCPAAVDVDVGLENRELCPEVQHCLSKRHYDWSIFNFCMRKILSPVLWGKKQCDCCIIWALTIVIEELDFHSVGTDFGPIFLALRLTELMNSGCCHPELTRSHVSQFFSKNGTVRSLFEKHNGPMEEEGFKTDLMEYIVFNQTNNTYRSCDSFSGKTVVLVVGPYGFENEPIFAPSLSAGNKEMVVVTLLLKHFIFPSSTVQMALFPWTLQVDVDFAALYVRSVMQCLRPAWVFPGDSAGILVLSKLTSQDQSPVLLKSGSSLLYPPPAMSKLVRGHEKFSPKEIVISESDGFHYVFPDLVNARKLMDAEFGGSGVYVKREYSEASRGVSKVADLRTSVANVFPRDIGIATMDLDLHVRIFLQQAVQMSRTQKPVAVRFFALNGSMVAGFLSSVLTGVTNFGFRYATQRDKRIEDKNALFIRSINFTGFGSTWWWVDEGTGVPFLIDFNARLERHACISSVLSEPEDLACDPCFAFGKIVAGVTDSRCSAGFVREGIEFVEPIRIAEKGDALLFVKESERLWNLNRSDKPLLQFVKSKLEHFFARSSLQEAAQVSNLKQELRKLEHEALSQYYRAWTPLHAACKMGRLDILKLLLEKGGNVCLTIRDAEGLTALDVGNNVFMFNFSHNFLNRLLLLLLLAIKYGHHDAAKLIMSHVSQ